MSWAAEGCHVSAQGLQRSAKPALLARTVPVWWHFSLQACQQFGDEVSQTGGVYHHTFVNHGV